MFCVKKKKLQLHISQSLDCVTIAVTRTKTEMTLKWVYFGTSQQLRKS